VKKEEFTAQLVKKTIFTYSTEHLLQKDKVRFYYALKGRDGASGIIVRLQIEQLGKTVLLVSPEHEAEVNEFLTFWKCEHQKRRIYLEH